MTTAADRLQPGIFFRSGERPPACFRVQLLNVRPGTAPDQARDAIAEIDRLAGELSAHDSSWAGPREDRTRVLFSGLSATLGYGRRFFDVHEHDPPLTERPRPPYLAYLDQHGNAFPAIPWDRDPPANRAEADVLLQLTGPHDAAVDCAIVEIWKLTVDEGLPLDPVGFFGGFGRPDGRGWLGFHDGVSNLESSQRRTAIEAGPSSGWMAGGTFMAFLRFRVDLAGWRSVPRRQQEQIVGRDKATGRPLGADPADTSAFRDPPETTDPALDASHVHRANQSRASPAAPGALRMFRQGYDYLESIGVDGPALGLNFVSFQSDLSVLQHLLHLPRWLGDVNFGGSPGPDSVGLITLADGGLYAVPPTGDPFPGADLFRPDGRRKT